MSFTSGLRFTAGNPIKAAADMTTLISNAEDVLNRCSLSMGSASSSAFSIPNNTETTLTLSTEIFDTDGFIDIAGAATRITVPTAFTLIQFTVNYSWSAAATDAYLYLRKNGGTSYQGTPEIQWDKMVDGSFSSAPLVVSAADYFELRAYHNTGGALNLTGTISVRAWK